MRLDKIIPIKQILAGEIGFNKEDNHKRMQLFAASILVAIAMFTCSTLFIFAATVIFSVMVSTFLLGDTWWLLVEIALILSGSLVMMIGLVAVLYATTVVREAGGRDTYGAVCRDWAWSFCLSFGIFSLVWWAGINMAVFIALLAGVLLFGAVTVVLRGELATHPRKRRYSVEELPDNLRVKIVISFAVMVVIIFWQLRLLADVYGLEMTRRMIWVFLAFGILSYFIDRTDRKARLPAPLQLVGAETGVAAAIAIQAIEILSCYNLGFGKSFLTAMAVMCQVPMAAFGATILCYHRKAFSYGGGGVGQYLSLMAAGIVYGSGFYWIAGRMNGFWWVLIILASLVILSSAWKGASISRVKPDLKQWLLPVSVLSATLLLAFALVFPFSRETAGGHVRYDLSFTSVENGSPDEILTREYLLPGLENRRSGVITECIGGIMSRRRGKWWIAAGSRRDIPDLSSLPAKLYAAGSVPAPPDVDVDKKYWPPVSVSHPDYFHYTKMNALASGEWRDYYDVIFMAPVPADHPHAWRCYNSRIMKRCNSMKYDYKEICGLVLLRTQTGGKNVRNILRIAQTFRKTLRSGWAVVYTGEKAIDILLVGPAKSLEYSMQDEKGEMVDVDLVGYIYSRLQFIPDHFLVPVNRLWTDMGEDQVRQVTIHSPPPDMSADYPSIDGLRGYLRLVQKEPEFMDKLLEKLRTYYQEHPGEVIKRYRGQ